MNRNSRGIRRWFVQKRADIYRGPIATARRADADGEDSAFWAGAQRFIANTLHRDLRNSSRREDGTE